MTLFQEQGLAYSIHLTSAQVSLVVSSSNEISENGLKVQKIIYQMIL